MPELGSQEKVFLDNFLPYFAPNMEQEANNLLQFFNNVNAKGETFSIPIQEGGEAVVGRDRGQPFIAVELRFARRRMNHFQIDYPFAIHFDDFDQIGHNEYATYARQAIAACARKLEQCLINGFNEAGMGGLLGTAKYLIDRDSDTWGDVIWNGHNVIPWFSMYWGGTADYSGGERYNENIDLGLSVGKLQRAMSLFEKRNSSWQRPLLICSSNAWRTLCSDIRAASFTFNETKSLVINTVKPNFLGLGGAIISNFVPKVRQTYQRTTDGGGNQAPFIDGQPNPVYRPANPDIPTLNPVDLVGNATIEYALLVNPARVWSWPRRPFGFLPPITDKGHVTTFTALGKYGCMRQHEDAVIVIELADNSVRQLSNNNAQDPNYDKGLYAN